MNYILKYSRTFTMVWALIIFVLCATPGHYIPSSDWMDLLSVDKLVHAGIFFVLSTLSVLTAIRYKRSNLTLGLYVLLCILYGSLLEWMQANYFSNRTADWQDVIANTVGCLGTLLVLKKLRTIHSQTINLE